MIQARNIPKITSQMIDFATFTTAITTAGSENVSVAANSGVFVNIAIPEQPDNNYIVLFSHQATTAAFAYAVPAAINKTKNSFDMYVWNTTNGTANATIGWAIVRNTPS